MLGVIAVLIAVLAVGWSGWRWLRPADCASCGKKNTLGRGGVCSNCGAVYRRDAF
jgi:hypothetical protein